MSSNFSTPVTAAQGRCLTDANVKIRPDGLAFLVGTGFTTNSQNAHIRNWLNLTVLNNGASYAEAVNADAGADDVPQKYPYLAFSPLDSTGYLVWRTSHPNPQGFGMEGYLRVIPPGYNGTTNRTLGSQIRLFDKVGFQFDQPSVAVDSRGNIYIAGYAATNPVTLSLVKLDRNLVFQNRVVIDTQPADSRVEMTPIIAIDRNDNIHIVAQFPAGGTVRQVAYSRVSPGTAFVKTDITPPGWIELRGRKAKDIAVGPGGEIYAAINNRGQLDLYKRTAGAGGNERWGRIQANLFQLYADSVAVTCSPDGHVWVAQADGKDSAADPRPSFGTSVRYSVDGGHSFSPPERVLPATGLTNVAVALDGNGPGSRIHLVGSFQFDYDHATTSYAAASVTGVPITPPPPPPPAPEPLPVPPNPPNPPVPDIFLPPSSFSVTALSFNQVMLYWKDKTTDEVEFSVERKDPGHDWSIVGSAPANSVSWLDVINIQPATVYTYRVRAHKTGLYSAYSLEVTVSTPMKPAPPVVTPTPPAPAPAPDAPEVLNLNGHHLSLGFLAYWRLWVQPDTIHPLGLPLSEEMDYTDAAGKKFVIQVFERGVLGYDISIADMRYRVQPLILGWDWLRSHFPGLVK